MDASRELPQKRIESTSLYPCNYCRKSHTKQAFISHSSKDKEIVERIGKACCDGDVAPYIYEWSPDISAPTIPADTLAKKIKESELILVVPSKSMSGAYWTQAWIGFEIGVIVGINVATRPKGMQPVDYFDKKIIVLQDIRQGVQVAIPRLFAISLFDFDSADSWKAASDTIRFLARVSQSEDEFGFRLGNKNQQAQMKADVKCKNPKCKSQYEAWITIADAPKLCKGFNRIDAPKDLRFKAECTIECPSCDQMVTRVFTQALIGPTKGEAMTDIKVESTGKYEWEISAQTSEGGTLTAMVKIEGVSFPVEITYPNGESTSASASSPDQVFNVIKDSIESYERQIALDPESMRESMDEYIAQNFQDKG